mgnify:CR=1 FL=1
MTILLGSYVSHILHIKKLLGTIENIAVATDDMSYYEIEPEYYQNANLFDFNTVANQTRKLLLRNSFNSVEIEKILHLNFEEKIQKQLYFN